MNQSPRWHLNAQDRQKIYTIIIHGATGILVTLISEVFLKINYGVWTPFITMGLSLVSLTLTQTLDGPSASTIRIEQLERLVEQQAQALRSNPTQPSSITPTITTIPPTE